LDARIIIKKQQGEKNNWSFLLIQERKEGSKKIENLVGPGPPVLNFLQTYP